MVEFLRRQQARGRLGSTFCTTHGSPMYIRRLIKSDAFDAVMLAYNPLGYHLLSFRPPAPRAPEAVRENRELFALAVKHGVGLMLMETLAGGLLCPPEAFAPHEPDALGRVDRPTARQVLRLLLRSCSEVACVVPGTASVVEAEENARAGHGLLHDVDEATDGRAIAAAVDSLTATVCSRCGQCDELCSRELPVSWMFRAAYIANGGAVPFETPLDHQYFDLHAPSPAVTCASCDDVTCRCPYGIDIPARLAEQHGTMMRLLERGMTPGPTPAGWAGEDQPRYAARLLSVTPAPGLLRAIVQNVGTDGWHSSQGLTVTMRLEADGCVLGEARLRADVPAGERGHFPIEVGDLPAPAQLWLVFRREGQVEVRVMLGPAVGARAEVRAAYAARYLSHTVPAAVRAGELCTALVTIQNAGSEPWRCPAADGHDVNIAAWVNGAVTTLRLPAAEIAPGACVEMPLVFRVPDDAHGRLPVKVDIVRQGVAFFADLGSPPLMLSPHVGAGEVGAELAAATGQYGVEFIEHRGPTVAAPGAGFGLWVHVRNTGAMSWDAGEGRGQHVRLAVTWEGQVLASAALPHAVRPLEEVYVHAAVTAPAVAGRHELLVDLVHEGVALFRDRGGRPLRLTLHVRGAVPAHVAPATVARQRNGWSYQPTAGVSAMHDGTPLPLMLTRAHGCHVWDTEGRRYIDYTMGWGCALLGHGHPGVERAVRKAMGCGPALPLPHPLEMRVTETLCTEMGLASAEAVAFGKNGSDACTLAVRLARAATGRRVVLVCGYHGWQDWYAEPLGFAGTSVPERERPLVHRFSFNDVASLRRAIAEHRADLAAVMLEPSGPAGEGQAGESGVCQGPGDDVDPAFLGTVAAEARAAGALVIFDEIITALRYRAGSVQAATGVTPDLTCLGKALANGFPLSAVVGRRAVFEYMPRAFYGPTYKGEVYSLAAAAAALAVHRREPVWEHVWSYGRRMRDGIDGICRDVGVAARMIGPVFRCGLAFEERDVGRLALLRTLYIQELLRHGLITYNGVMLPAFAHTEATLKQTLSAVRAALGTVAAAQAGGERELHRAIEIPLIKVSL